MSVEATGGKVLAAVAKGGTRRLLEWIRPDISPAALRRHSDYLAADVKQREDLLFGQLGGGPGTVIDNLLFQADPRVGLAACDELGLLADIAKYFRRQKSRRLVVLGEPGAGKTLAVVRFVRDQLDYRKTLTDAERADEPVPVRVNATGWDGNTEFNSWMASQLSIGYGLNPRLALAMVKTNHILPVVDGLDEMDPIGAKPLRARAALERLNRLPWRDRAVVVSCRSKSYAAIRDFRENGRDGVELNYATVITLQPLLKDEIKSYLENHRGELKRDPTEWRPIIGELDKGDGVLAEALSTPWMLSLAATALKDGGQMAASELAECRDADQVCHQLFASLIPAAMYALPDTQKTINYTQENVHRWLRALAQHLEHRRVKHSGGAQIALDEIWEIAGSRQCRAIHALAVGLVAGLGIGIGCTQVFEMTWALVVGVTVLVGVALYFGLTLDANSSSERFAWRVPGKSRWRRGVVAGLVAALVSGIAMGVVFWLAFRPAVGLIAGVLLGVAMGCVTGLQFGMDTNAEERLILGQDANRLIRDDLTAALMVGLMFFVIAGLTFFGFGAALAHRPGVFLMLTVRLTLILGLIGALVTGSMHAVAAGRYAVASVIFRVSGRFPSRSAQFLDWARTVGLLRVTGISYQFRHDSYGEWLIASGGNETGIIKSDSRVEVDSG